MLREKYYELINQYPSIKEYEDWNKEKGIDLESISKTGLTEERDENIVCEARNMVDERFQTIVKNKKAWYMTALKVTAYDDPFLKYNILDEMILGQLIWNETKSVDKLYKVANLRWGDPLVAADTYEGMVYFLKANGEFVDATNPKARQWGLWLDEQFNVDEQIQRLERDVMLNKDGELLRKLTNAGRDAK